MSLRIIHTSRKIFQILSLRDTGKVSQPCAENRCQLPSQKLYQSFGFFIEWKIESGGLTEDVLEAEAWNIKLKELEGESIQINILIYPEHRKQSSFSNS